MLPLIAKLSADLSEVVTKAANEVRTVEAIGPRVLELIKKTESSQEISRAAFEALDRQLVLAASESIRAEKPKSGTFVVLDGTTYQLRRLRDGPDTPYIHFSIYTGWPPSSKPPASATIDIFVRTAIEVLQASGVDEVSPK